MALFDSTFIRYSLVGLLNTGITLGTVFLLMFLNVHYLIANGVGYLAGALNSFYFNKHFTFNAKQAWSSELSRFIFSMVFCYLIQWFFLLGAVEYFTLSKVFSQIAGNVIFTILFYILCKWFVFNSSLT